MPELDLQLTPLDYFTNQEDRFKNFDPRPLMITLRPEVLDPPGHLTLLLTNQSGGKYKVFTCLFC